LSCNEDNPWYKIAEVLKGKEDKKQVKRLSNEAQIIRPKIHFLRCSHHKYN
jgi:hypothetical protein